jgi:hypothetical protein
VFQNPLSWGDLEEEHPGFSYPEEKGGMGPVGQARILKYQDTAQAGHTNRRALGKKNQKKYREWSVAINK